jgi:hypothetical protein
MMTLYSPDKSALLQISAIERKGNDLVIKGKVFGTMPITAHLRPSEARQGLKLVGLRNAWFILTLLLRRG